MRVLYVLFLLDTLNLAVFIPVFSAFVRSIGGSPFILGLINSSSALISLLWNPVVGSLSDQIGRKGLLLKCMMASSIGSLILCASSSSLILVFVARLIGALGSPVAILLRSTVADIFKTDEEKKLFLNKSAPIISLAFLFGSIFSGFLSEAKNGYVMTFLMMAVTMAIAIFIAMRRLPDDAKSTAQINDSTFVKKAAQELKTAAINIKSISWPRYKQLFYMKGFTDFSMAIIFANLGLLMLIEFEVKGRTVGLIFLMIGLCRIISTVAKLKLKNIVSNVPDYQKIFYGDIMLFISYIGMFFSTSLPVCLIFLGLMCLIRPFMDITFVEIITTRTMESDRGKVIAAYENLFPFCMFISPLLSGIIAEVFGQRILLGLAAIPVSISILVAYKQRNKTD